MEAVNGVSEGDKGGPPPPSPLTGCYLLIVIGEPHSNQHKDIILQRVAKGLLSWDVNDCLVDLEKELAIITEQALEGEEARYGERLIQYASENLVTEILIHPVVSTLAQCVRNLLSSFTRHRHIIHAGYTFAANGSWALQDGTFSLADFSEAFQEIEVQRVIRAYENGISLDLHCSSEGDWSRLPKEPFARNCKVRVNPNDVLTAGSPSITSFINYISPFLISSELENLLESSDVVGNIRFSRPTLYVFPGGQGDAALFGINGFNMLLDGGFSRKACFWDFVRHLDRLDAVLMTRLNNCNVNGISAVLKRKKQDAVYPQIGHFFSNINERKAILSPDGDKDKDPLLINLIDEGQEIISNLRHLNLNPQVCYRDSEPINLYHKVGHGTLDMYVLSPAKDSKEVREFLIKWNNSDQKLFANTTKSSREFMFPLQNLVSICALLVWQPANPNDTITRILYPGSSPQKKIFEGLDRLKNLEFIKHPVCTATSLIPATIIKTKQIRDSILDKTIPTKEKPSSILDTKKTSDKILENKVIENNLKNGELNGVVDKLETDKTVKKSDSTESDKSLKATKKPDDSKLIEDADKPKTKPVQRTTTRRSESQKRRPVGGDKKASPTTPKKNVDNKVNGDAKKPIKPSPTGTPAKSAKDANNRKVIESKIKSVPKKEPSPKPAAEPKPKVERKPISRRPKGTTKAPISPLKKVNGIQKPDSISRKGKLDKEGTTDSSTVSTPSADQDSILKKDISKLTPEELQQLKAQELADLKEEQEAIKEIEAVFRKSEKQVDDSSSLRKIKDISIEDKLEPEEYLIIEKEVIEQDSIGEKDVKEDEIQKLARDSEESEKQRKLSNENVQEQITEVVKEVEVEEEKKEPVKEQLAEPVKDSTLTTPEEKAVSPDKKVPEKDEDGDENKEVPQESQPDEKVSANVESGATTTAPTLPEDERITLDDIKEDNGQVIEEKHVKEETKEKEVPVIQLPPKSFENVSKLPPVVGIRLDKQSHIRDIVKTPDEVADLPVHEEADYNEYSQDIKPTEEQAGKDAKGDEKPTKDDEEVLLKKSKDQQELKALTDAVLSNDSVMAADITIDNDKDNQKATNVTEEKTENDVLGKKELTKSPDEEKEEDEHEKQGQTEQVTTATSKEIIISEVVEHLNDIKEDAEDKLSEDEEKDVLIEKAEDQQATKDVKDKPEEKVENDKELKGVEQDSNKVVEKEETVVDDKDKIEETKLEDKKDDIKLLKDEKVEIEATVATEEKKDEVKLVEDKKDEKNQVDLEKKAIESEPQPELKVKEKKDEVPAKKDDVKLEENVETNEKTVNEEKKDDVKVVEEKQDVKDDVKLEKTTIESEPKPVPKDDKDVIKQNETQVAKVDEKIVESEPKSVPGENKDKKSAEDEKKDDKKKEDVIIDDKVSDIITEKPKIEETTNKEPAKEEPVEEKVKEIKENVREMSKLDEKLLELKEDTHTLIEAVSDKVVIDKIEVREHPEPVIIAESAPETPDVEDKLTKDIIDKCELGRKSPKEREEDVLKIVTKVAEVLKSDAPLEEFEGKIPITLPPYTAAYTTELRETHITTCDSPLVENKPIKIDDIPPIPEEPSTPKANESFEEEPKPNDQKRSSLIKESQELMMATSKIISDIKSNKVEETENKDEPEIDSGTVHRMLVTTSSEDGGEEIEICPPGTITFSRSSESSGRSSPDLQKTSQKSSVVDTISDTLSTVRQVQKNVEDEKKKTIDDAEKRSSVVSSGKSSPELKEKTAESEIPVDLSGKSTPDVQISKEAVESEIVKESASVQKDQTDISGKSTPEIGVKDDVNRKSSQEIDLKDTKSDFSGKSTPDIGLKDTKVDLSGKSTPEVGLKEVKGDLSDRSTTDVGLKEAKSDLSGKSTPEVDLKETKSDISGKSTPELDVKDTKVDLSGKSTPDIGLKEVKNDVLGKSEPNVGLKEVKSDLSGKSTPEVGLKEVKSDLSGKSTPDVGLKEVKSDLSGKSTPDVGLKEVKSDLSGKSTPDVGLKEVKSDLSGKSTPDIGIKDTKSDLSGKSTPEIGLKDTKSDVLEKATPDAALKDAKIDLSGKSTPEVGLKVAKSDVSGKSTPDFDLKEAKVDLSGKSTPEVLSKDISSGKSSPDIGKSGSKEQTSGKSTPDSGLEDTVKQEKSEIKEKDIATTDKSEPTSSTRKDELPKDTLPINTSSKPIDKSPDLSGKSTPDSVLKDSEKQEPSKEETSSDLSVKTKEKSPELSGKSTPDSGLKEGSTEDILNKVKKEITPETVERKSSINEPVEKSPHISRKSTPEPELQVKETKQDLGQSPTISEKSTPSKRSTENIKETVEQVDSLIPQAKSPSISGKSTPEIKEDKVDVVEEVCKKIDVSNNKSELKGSSHEVAPSTIDLKKVESAIEEQIIKDFNEVQQKHEVTEKEKQLAENKAEEKQEIIEEKQKVVEEKQDSPEKSIFDTIKDTVQQVEKDLEETLSKSATILNDTVEKINESVKSGDEKSEELLEKSANELTETFDHVKEMGKSVVFDKCASIEKDIKNVVSKTAVETVDKLTEVKTSVSDKFEQAEKKTEEVVEKSTKDFSESFAHLTDMGKSVIEEKSEKVADVVDKTKSTLTETLKSVEDLKDSFTSSLTTAQKEVNEFVEKSTVDLKEKYEKTDKELQKKINEVVDQKTKALSETLDNVTQFGVSKISDKCEKTENEIEKKFSDFVEKETKELSETLEDMKEMTSSVIFEKCEKAENEVEKKFNDFVEKETKELTETLQDVKEMSSTVIFEKCEKAGQELEKKISEVVDKETKQISETASAVLDKSEKIEKDIKDTFDMSKSVIFGQSSSDKVIEKPETGAITNGVGETVNDIIDEASDFIKKTASGLQQNVDMSKSVIFDNGELLEDANKPSVSLNGVEKTKDSTDSKAKPAEMCKLDVGQSDAKKLSISDVEISLEDINTATKEVEEPLCTKKVCSSMIEAEKSLYGNDIKISDKETTVCDKVNAQKDDELKTADNVTTDKSSVVTVSIAGPSTDDEKETISGKSTPDIGDKQKDKHIPGKCTPPTVPVSPVIKDTVAASSAITSLKDSELRSCTPASDDYDISSSRTPNLYEKQEFESDDEDIPGSPMSITSQVAHSRSSSHYDFEEDTKLPTSKIDPMNMSLYGALPSEEQAPPTHLYEITKAKYSAGTSDDYGNANIDGNLQLDKLNQNGTNKKQEDDLMSASFIGELPTAPPPQQQQPAPEQKKDPIESWGKPLGLPSPAPPNNNQQGTPKKEKKLSATVTAKNKLNDDRKRSESPSKYRNKRMNSIYVDLTYVPHHGNSYYSYVDFFKRVRARYYVFSGIEPSREVYNALLEAKQTWEDKELEVTIIPTYDTDILGYWVAENEELLSKYKIDLSPSASRCTINLQDHETSCSAYRLEF